MGHTDPSLALEIYTKVMERRRDTGARTDALVQGAVGQKWGGSSRMNPCRVAHRVNRKPRFPGLSQLRD
jgi:hypothetical protein